MVSGENILMAFEGQGKTTDEKAKDIVFLL
jgi:hypothetical protein